MSKRERYPYESLMEPKEYPEPKRVVQDKKYKYLYFMDSNHPLGDKKGRVLHHRHVASVAAGRWVTKTEVVHHVDHVRDNNDPTNLEIVGSLGEHARHHVSERISRVGRKSKVYSCKNCHAKFFVRRGDNQTFCSLICKEDSNYPSDSALTDMVWELPATDLAKYYGLSSSALKKHCKTRNIPTPGRGYWTSVKQ